MRGYAATQLLSAHTASAKGEATSISVPTSINIAVQILKLVADLPFAPMMSGSRPLTQNLHALGSLSCFNKDNFKIW